MLTRSGTFNEEELIEAIKNGPYLPLYGMFEKQECQVPYREMDEGKMIVKYVVFTWLAGQWIATEVKR
jgi:hypothetical protein